MLADMSRTSCMLIVCIVIKLIICKRVLICYESHIIRDVLLLHEVLDVEAQVDD